MRVTIHVAPSDYREHAERLSEVILDSWAPVDTVKIVSTENG